MISCARCLLLILICLGAAVSVQAAISVEGTLLMLDDRTPHVAVTVQAMRDGKQIDKVVSNGEGKYQFINLKPGIYQIRCYTPRGYIDYGQENQGKPTSQTTDSLQVEHGKTVRNVDFRFPPIKKGTWRHYSSLNGLERNAVNRIYVDSDGFLWLGTNGGGVSRFDGKDFTNFTDEDGLPLNASIWSIHQDASGVMWFGTWGGNGVYRYDGKKFTHFGEGVEGLANAWNITAINSDSNGAIWFGTNGGKVYRYDGKGFAEFTTEEGFVGGWVHDIHQGTDGMMWFVTAKGVPRYNGKAFTTFTPKEALVNYGNAFTSLANDHYSIHRDANGGLWYVDILNFGMQHQGVGTLHPEGRIRRQFGSRHLAECDSWICFRRALLRIWCGGS